MHKYGATFGPLPNPEEAPHEGMVKALVPFCGLDDESIFHDSLASESRTFKKAIVTLKEGDTIDFYSNI